VENLQELGEIVRDKNRKVGLGQTGRQEGD